MFLFKAKSNIGGLNMSQAKLGFSLSVPVVSVHALSHACLTIVTGEEARGTTHKKQSSSLFDGPGGHRHVHHATEFRLWKEKKKCYVTTKKETSAYIAGEISSKTATAPSRLFASYLIDEHAFAPFHNSNSMLQFLCIWNRRTCLDRLSYRNLCTHLKQNRNNATLIP